MNAYTLVDGNVRKKLDETLKTWREPVPGSLSTTPVFRLDITQRVVDALSKARLAAQQTRNQQMPLMASRMAVAQAQPFRNTPTPPQNLPNYGRPTYSTHTQPPSRNGFTAPYTTAQVRSTFAYSFDQLTLSIDLSSPAAKLSCSASARTNVSKSSTR